MKKYNCIIIFIICLFTLGCNKDLGNYTYQDIAEFKGEGIDSLYHALTGQRFVLDPLLKAKDGSVINEKGYTFEWFTVDEDMKLDEGKRRMLDSTLVLDLKLPLSPSNYTLYLRVFDKNTQLVRQYKTKLIVTSEIADGWLVLNDINGESRLDMLSYNAKTNAYVQYTDLLSTTSTLKLKGKPKLVYYVYNRNIFNNQFTNRVYVGTDQVTYSINNQQRTWDDYRNLKVEVIRPTTDSYHAQEFRSMGMSVFPMTYMLDSDGYLSLENSTVGFIYGPALNRFVGENMLHISPFIAEKYKTPSHYLLMFDVDKRRFLVHFGNNKSVIQPTSTQPDVFSPADVKKDLVFMAQVQSSTPQFYAILKDPTSANLSLLRFVAPDNTRLTPLAYEEIPAGSQLKHAEKIALDPNFGYIIFSIGGKVYQYDPFNKVEKILIDLNGRNISLIKFHKPIYLQSVQRYIDLSKKLVIASYDPKEPNSTGTLELYEMSLTGAAKLSESYTGYGKIVDVSYRE